MAKRGLNFTLPQIKSLQTAFETFMVIDWPAAPNEFASKKTSSSGVGTWLCLVDPPELVAQLFKSDQFPVPPVQ